MTSAVDDIAEFAVRRWNSFGRRSKGRRDDRERRIEDVSKGLVPWFESDPRTIGPLADDYRFLASRIVGALTVATSE